MHDIARKIYNGPDEKFQVLDSRGTDGFSEGHIKNSVNLPFNLLVNEDGTLKSFEELGTIFKELGFDHSKTTVNTCGSGVTACILDLGLRI
jgi:thiosulfate/3-mercaptopyruvate sulfurtransferase